MTQDKQKLLLSVLGVLLLAKFVLVPWVETQDEQVQALQVLVKKLQRSEMLLTSEQQLNELYAEFLQKQQSLLEPIPQVESTEQYKLLLQQQVQDEIGRQGLSLVLFDWLGQLPVEAYNVQKATVTIRVNGAAQQMVALHQWFQQQPFIQISETDINWNGPLQVGTEQQFVLVVTIFYRLPHAE